MKTKEAVIGKSAEQRLAEQRSRVAYSRRNKYRKILPSRHLLVKSQLRCSDVFIVNFKQISHIVLVFLF